MVSKVSTTLGLSSASMAAKESEFFVSSSSKSPSSAAPSAAPSSPSARSPVALNGVGAAGAVAGAGVCGGCMPTIGALGCGATGWPSGPIITGAGMGLASGPA